MVFQNRKQAGRLLGERLKALSIQNPIILALPRGGIPIGYEIAKMLGAPLGVLIVRKVGAPLNPEFGIGAISEEGYYWIDSDTARAVRATPSDIQRIARQEQAEVNRLIKQYRGGRSLPDLHGKTVIVVDDGLATGVTARVACHYLEDKGAQKVILAIPVCSPRSAEYLRSEIDELLCLSEPEAFQAVGQFYRSFEQLSDEQVISLLSRSKEAEMEPREICEKTVIEDEGLRLPASVSVPASAKGIVIFAHEEAGAAGLSSKNQQVAGALVEAGFGTLLFDLLTEDESLNRANVFNISLLASRLVLATRWVREQAFGKNLPIGYFGTSTGAAAALGAAADLGSEISAIVSRGGRPDLAISLVSEVVAPTLLIVGGEDESVVAMNEQALRYLRSGSLVVIPRAAHLFEEPGALEMVTKEAILWFRKHLAKEAARRVA